VGEHRVAAVDDLPADRGLVVDVQGRRIGVFRVGEEVFAVQAVCPHQAGPVGQGGIFPRLCAKVENERLVEWLDHTRPTVACPWHGWEFDLRSGACLADPKRGLVRYEAVARDGDVFVTV
jgi:nitrite reductase (NADH) small subunit